MTEKEAISLAAQIERDYAGLIEASPELYRSTSRIRLLLIAGQRKALVYHPREWESFKLAWHWLLYGEDAEPEVPPRASKPPASPRYLVDGRVMRIRQVRTRRQKTYWIGAYQEGGKTKQRYFGKTDPRDRYPLVEEVPAS